MLKSETIVPTTVMISLATKPLLFSDMRNRLNKELLNPISCLLLEWINP